MLFYGKVELENDSKLLFDVMGKDDKDDVLDEEIIIVRLKKDLMNEFGSKFKLKAIKSNRNDNTRNSDEQLPRILKSSISADNRMKRKNYRLNAKFVHIKIQYFIVDNVICSFVLNVILDMLNIINIKE